jgi:hypothetical protein
LKRFWRPAATGATPEGLGEIQVAPVYQHPQRTGASAFVGYDMPEQPGGGHHGTAGSARSHHWPARGLVLSIRHSGEAVDKVGDTGRAIAAEQGSKWKLLTRKPLPDLLVSRHCRGGTLRREMTMHLEID